MTHHQLVLNRKYYSAKYHTTVKYVKDLGGMVRFVTVDSSFNVDFFYNQIESMLLRPIVLNKPGKLCLK